MSEFLSSPIANGLTLTLLHFVWQGLVVALLCWILLAMAGRKSARVRYWISLKALVLMAVAPLVTFVTVYDSCLVENEPAIVGAPPTIVAPDSVVVIPSPVQEDRSAASPLRPDSEQSIVEQNTVSPQWHLTSTKPFVLVLWMTGVLLSGARLLAGFGNVVWLHWGRAEANPELLRRSQQIAQRLGMATARVFSSDRIREAAVVGFWKPVVLLPTSWLTLLPTDVLEAVIAHELAHIRRYDVWVNLLQRIVESLLFYHPAVWWLSNRVRLEREMCCDVLAAEMTGDRGEYALALEQVGRLQAQRTTQLSPAFLGDRKMNMLNRVKHVLGGSVKTDREPAWLVGIVALTIPALIVGVSGVHPGLNVAAAQDAAASKAIEPEPPRLTGVDALPSDKGEPLLDSNSKSSAGAPQPITKAAPASTEGSGVRYQIQTTSTGVVLLDTKTGDSWSLSERDGARVWLPITRSDQKPTHAETTDREPVVTDEGATIEFRGTTPIRLTLGSRFDSAVIKRISELTTLEEIDARHCIQLRDAGLAHFAELTKLRKLKLPAGIGDSGVQHLAGLTELVQPLFQDATITAAGMEHLKALVKLEELGFWRCTSLTDAGFVHLEGMTALKSLDLRRCAKLTMRRCSR